MTRIRLGHHDPFRPFCWTEGSTAQGTFVAALHERLPPGTPLEWVPGPLDALPQWLASGRIDAIAPQAITPARAAALALSEPLLHTAAALFAPAGQGAPDPATAGALRIATPTGGPLAALLSRLAPQAVLHGTAGYVETLDAVLAGRADLAALNIDAGADLIARRYPDRFAPPGRPFARLGLAVAAPAGDPMGVLLRLGLNPLGQA